jgi:pimeloyl-ACP methyl ester carboxylesterase
VERFASFDGTEIAYTVGGSGSDVLLLHGFAADHRVNWVVPGVVDALVAGGHRVIAYDARGHGASGKPHDPDAYAHDAMPRDAAALLDHLDISAVDVVGYSMGAMVSSRLVPDEPRTRSLVLGGVGANIAGGMPRDRRAAIADALEAPDAASVPNAAARGFRLFAEGTGADLLALAAMQRAPRVHGKPDLDAIKVPALVVVGDDDVLAGDPAELAALLPNARSRVVTGDHLGAVSDPAFREAIVAFLRPS